MNFEGYLPSENERTEMSEEELEEPPPGIEEANQTKETAAYTEILNGGTAQVYENGREFKKFGFEDEEFTGLWILKREDTSKFWIMEQEEISPET